MRAVLLIGVLLCGAWLRAQDRIYSNDGSTIAARVVRVGSDSVYFLKSDTAQTVQALPKNKLVLIEFAGGKRYVFAAAQQKNSKDSLLRFRHLLGVQPLGALVGRGTVVYEQLFENGSIGLVIPLSLSFLPRGAFYDSLYAQRSAALPRLSYIVGADVNFYTGKPFRGFFLGPRLRYGTDLFLGGLKGYTLQTQAGLRSDTRRRVVQHISIGLGMLYLQEYNAATARLSNYLPWASVNYRISFQW